MRIRLLGFLLLSFSLFAPFGFTAKTQKITREDKRPSGAGDWPAVRNIDNSGASALLGGKLTSPTLVLKYKLPNFTFPALTEVKGTPPAATETGWGQQKRPATQDFAGNGGQQTFMCDNSADQVKVKVIDSADKKVLWEQEIDLKHRPQLYLLAPIIADVVPELPGDEAIFFGDWIDKARKAKMKVEGDDGLFGYICCASFAGGKGHIVWENEQDRITYSPGVLVDDVDGDGIKDIVVSVHYRLFILNGKTGKMTYNVFFSHGRNYALMHVFQQKGDPLKKIVVSGDFYQETTIVELYHKPDGSIGARAPWTMLFDDTVGLKNVITYSMPQLMQDISGDGRPRLLLNFFNIKGHEIKSVGGFDNPLGDTNGDGICDGVSVIGREPYYVKGDGRWHVLALDPETGRVSQEVSNQWYDGAGDLNGDGKPELFMLKTRGEVHPGYGELSLWNQQNGKLKKIWSAPGTRSRCVRAQLGYRPHYAANIVNQGIPLAADLDGDGRMEFLLLTDRDGDWNADQLECYTVERGKEKPAISRKWIYDAPGCALEVPKLAPAAGRENAFVISVGDRINAQLHLINPASGKEEGSPAPWTQAGSPWNPYTVAGDFDGDGKLELAICNTSNQTQVLKFHPRDNDAQATLTEQIRLPGHGLYADNPLIDDLDGDGKSEFVLAQPGPHGEIQLAAFTITGKKLWATPVADATYSTLGDRSPGGFTGRPIAADLNGDGTKDVFFSVFGDGYSNKEGLALDGKNGHLLWRVRGFPGHDSSTMMGTRDLVTHADVNGDKREEVVLCSGFYPQIVEGTTGKVLSPFKVVEKMFELDALSCAYFSPIVADVDADGQQDIYWFGGGRYHVLTDLALKKKWDLTNQMVIASGQGAEVFSSVGRMHPSGPMDILFDGTTKPPKTSVNYVWNEADNNRLICVNGATGAIEWSWRPNNKENFKSNPVLADVDGDRLHEALVIVGSVLYAVKTPAEGQTEPSVLWAYQLPEGYPSPANIMVVDADGDGNPEILLAGTFGSNGMLFMLAESGAEQRGSH